MRVGLPDSDRSRETRRRLLDAARVLFMRLGYHETRPQDIAREAGVGSGTFYNHFADKRECFLAFADEAANEVDEIVERKIANATSVSHLIHGLFDALDEYVIANRGVLAAALTDPDVIDPATIRIAPRLVDRWAQRWAELLTKLREDGAVATDLDLVIVGHGLVGLMYQATSTQQRGAFSRAELRATVVKFIVRALEPPEK